MKKTIVLLLFFILSCSLNENTGLIVITNLSDTVITNINVGDQSLVLSLSPGEKYDYWFYNNMSGIVTAEEVSEVRAKYFIDGEEADYVINKYDPVCNFKLYYQYNIDIQNLDGSTVLIVNEGVSPQTDDNLSTQYDYPAQ